MKNTIVLLIAMCISYAAFSQANGSFYTIQLGKKICLFKYQEKADSTYVETDSAHSKTIVTQINAVTLAENIKWVKDTVVLRKSLSLQDGDHKIVKVNYALIIDTITMINPVTLEETIEVKKRDTIPYHIETEMTYSDFLILLKSHFELKNPQRNFRVYSYDIYYETATQGGMIKVKYPATSEGVITKLNALTKGGFILLSLNAADHDEVPIDAQGRWLALIHVRN
jgi:hypothetical protein